MRAIPVVLSLSLAACVGPEAPDYRAGPPLGYRCAETATVRFVVATPLGMGVGERRIREPSRYESTTEGEVVRVAVCREV